MLAFQPLPMPLLHLGVPQTELSAAVSRVDTALVLAMSDERGRWIMSNRHQEARSGVCAISSARILRLVNVIVDRTFIDQTCEVDHQLQDREKSWS